MNKDNLNDLRDLPINFFMDEIKGCINAIEHYIDIINKHFLIAKEEENTTAINLILNYEKEFYDKYNKGLLK